MLFSWDLHVLSFPKSVDTLVVHAPITFDELSEHTASMPAILHFIQGEATLTLGDETVEAERGTWIHMPPELKHSVRTKTSVVMLLLLLKK